MHSEVQLTQLTLHMQLFPNEGINPLSLFPFVFLCHLVLLSVFHPVCLLPSICLIAPNDPQSVSCLSFPHVSLPVILHLFLFVSHSLGYVLFSPYRFT